MVLIINYMNRGVILCFYAMKYRKIKKLKKKPILEAAMNKSQLIAEISSSSDEEMTHIHSQPLNTTVTILPQEE